MANETVRILGIDPGLRRCGWGLITSAGQRISYVASGFVTSDAAQPLAIRLCEIYDGLNAMLAEFAPDEAAVEETFVNDNARATLKLGQARGMALLAPAKRNIKVAEYSPNLIKKCVVGSGHADKKQVQAMVRFLLPKATFSNADEADALAIAICHAHQRKATAQALLARSRTRAA
ncbi:MAG: crossover junction endodeoxyribonuclease RuvC [Pseudomonadota bacterium]